jgi:hypothetical protein
MVEGREGVQYGIWYRVYGKQGCLHPSEVHRVDSDGFRALFKADARAVTLPRV